MNSKEEETLDSLGIAAFVLFAIAALISHYGTHPKWLGEIRNESWDFFCSLFTTAGWSAVGRAVGQEGRSIADSVTGIFTGPEKVYLRSDNLIDTCRTELQKHVYLNPANIRGDVDGDRIHLFMVHKELTNSFSPHFYGKLQARPSGTVIQGRFTMARFVMAFLAVWFGGVGVATVMVTPSSITTLVSGRTLVLNPVLGAFFPPCLLLCGFLMVHWGSRLGRSDKADIVRFLQHALNARQETSR